MALNVCVVYGFSFFSGDFITRLNIRLHFVAYVYYEYDVYNK